MPWVEETGTILVGLFTRSGSGPAALDQAVDYIRQTFHGARRDGLVIRQVDGPHDVDPEGFGEWWQLAMTARYTFQTRRDGHRSAARRLGGLPRGAAAAAAGHRDDADRASSVKGLSQAKAELREARRAGAAGDRPRSRCAKQPGRWPRPMRAGDLHHLHAAHRRDPLGPQRRDPARAQERQAHRLRRGVPADHRGHGRRRSPTLVRKRLGRKRRTLDADAATSPSGGAILEFGTGAAACRPHASVPAQRQGRHVREAPGPSAQGGERWLATAQPRRHQAAAPGCGRSSARTHRSAIQSFRDTILKLIDAAVSAMPK